MAHLFRENSGKMVAILSRIFGLNQIDIIMDVVQDTFEAALTKWRFSGIPDNPPAWLMQVAKNKAVNAFKKENRKISSSVYLSHFETSFENQFNILLSPKEIKDSQLRLLFACCNPVLSENYQIIITLNILCGFGVPEISNALLMKDEAVKKALFRSKKSLRELDNILETQIITQSFGRIETVHAILYLMFNEGYKTTRSKKPIDKDLCFEAIRLAKLLAENNTALTSETNALLALMFFNISRFSSRITSEGEWLSLEEQNRNAWDKAFIEEGFFYLGKATQSDVLTRFHIEAIIASVHCSAATFEETDWARIAWLYAQLEKLQPASPLVKLNRVIAESHLPCGDNLIKDLDAIATEESLKNNFLLPATKAHIYNRNGNFEKAKSEYRQALHLAVSPIDKTFLKRKIEQCKQKEILIK